MDRDTHFLELLGVLFGSLQIVVRDKYLIDDILSRVLVETVIRADNRDIHNKFPGSVAVFKDYSG